MNSLKKLNISKAYRLLSTSLLAILLSTCYQHLAAQNYVQNPSFENGGPLGSGGFTDVDPANPNDPDPFPFWAFGCHNGTGFFNDWTVFNDFAAINLNSGDNPGIYAGDRSATGSYMWRIDPVYGGEAIMDERLRGMFTAALPQGAYTLGAAFAGATRPFGELDEDAEIEVYLINPANPCPPARLIHTQSFDSDNIWRTFEQCFTIDASEAGLYDQFEFRIDMGAPNRNEDIFLFLDEISVEPAAPLVDLNVLTGNVCQDELLLDVSKLDDFTLIGVFGSSNCYQNLNGQTTPIIDLNAICNVECGAASQVIILYPCNDRWVELQSPVFQVPCTPEIDLGPDISICEGQPWPVLTANGGLNNYEWTWNGGATQNAPTNGGTTLQTTGPGVYCVTAQDIHTCPALDCIEITVLGEVVTDGGFNGTGSFSSSLSANCVCTHGTYCIVEEPVLHCNQFPTGIFDQENPGTGHFMSIYSDQNSGSQTIWQQQVDLVAGETYDFSMLVNCYGQSLGTNRPELRVYLAFLEIARFEGQNLPSNQWEEWVPTTTTYTAPLTFTTTLMIVQANQGCMAYGLDDVSLRTQCCVADEPENLGCTDDNGARMLVWDPVPGADHYEVQFWTQAPFCDCPPSPRPSEQFGVIAPTNMVDPPWRVTCTAWRVRSVCPDSSKSTWSDWTCYWAFAHCPPPGPPQKTAPTTPQPKASGLEVYPNPATDRVEIRLGKADHSDRQLQVLDLTGKAVAEIAVQSGLEALSWQIPAVLPAGMYHLRLRTGQAIESVKLIITR